MSSSTASAWVVPPLRRLSSVATAASRGDGVASSSTSSEVAGNRRMFCIAGSFSLNLRRAAAGMVSSAILTVLSTLAMFDASCSDCERALLRR